MTQKQYEHIDMGGAVKLINEPDPANPQEAATKHYVDTHKAYALRITAARYFR